MLPFIFPSVFARSLCAQPERLVVIDKASRTLTLYTPGRFPKVFPVSIGLDPVSDKRRLGDCATPEGLYQVSHKRMSKRFHKFIGISYPNLLDACRALIRGVISQEELTRILSAHSLALPPPTDTPLGNHIGIHGGGVVNMSGGKAATDWTEGCVAMENGHIESVFSAIRPRDPILIFHSGKDLYEMLSPFAAPRPADIPTCCLEGMYRGEVWIETAIGIIHAEIVDSRDFTRSLTCRLYAGGDDPSFIFEDRDGDGRWGPLDRISGSLMGETNPPTIIERIRKEVADALKKGAIAPLSEAALVFSQRHPTQLVKDHGPGNVEETH